MTPLTSTSKLDEILHALVLLGITAASMFVKNPNSQQHAVSIINATNQIVLPLVDSLVNQVPPAVTVTQ